MSSKSNWRQLKGSSPGSRFQDYHDWNRNIRQENKYSVKRIIRIVAAVACIMIGILLIFLPGPAILFFLIAATLLAAESRFLARLIDSGEVKLRKAWVWLRSRL